MQYLDDDRLMSIAQGPRNCSVTDVEDLCSEVAYQNKEIDRLNAIITAFVMKRHIRTKKSIDSTQ